tara:strand:- start:40970 stop:41770 length:801 start_codon:yes stop_codon:yes gene_type:complete
MLAYRLKKILFYLLPPIIMDVIVKIYRRLFSKNPKQLEEPVTSYHPDFSQVKYSTEGFVMNIPSEKIRYYGGIAFSEEQHHFIQFYYKGIKALERFYQSHKPKNIFQRHYINKEFKNSESLPWLYESFDLDKSEHGLDMISHGHQAFGPVSNAKIRLESKRLTKILKSIRKVGYDISHGLPRGYFLIDTNGSWVFHVVGGKHRMAALIYLGWKNIPCQLEPCFPRTVYIKGIDEWPGVRSEDFSEQDAREIFYSYFRDPNSELMNE